MARKKYTYIWVLLLTAAMSTAFAPVGRAKPDAGIPPAAAYHAGAAAKHITITFAGDLMQHIPQVNAAKSEDGTYSYADCFRHIAPFFRESDIAVVNLETTLADSLPYSGYPTFRSPSRLAADMKEAGIDVALLANNHICDQGSKGIGRTIAAVDSAGMYYTGAFADSAGQAARHPLVMERNGFRVNILNYTEHTNGLRVPQGRFVNLIDTAAMARDLARIEPHEDNLTFVCLHWGWEYFTRQNAYQDWLAAWLRDKGVDFIIGSHPHVIQPVEVSKDSVGRVSGLTAWSLGNFVSNQQQTNTDGGLVLHLSITKRAGEQVEISPRLFYAWTYRPVENGRRRYYIIPSYSADSLLGADSVALKKQKKFLSAARGITGGSRAVREIKEFRPKRQEEPPKRPYIFKGYAYPSPQSDTLP